MLVCGEQMISSGLVTVATRSGHNRITLRVILLQLVLLGCTNVNAVLWVPGNQQRDSFSF